MVGITLRNLTKRYGRVLAVDDVTLEVRPGELFFLLGPSGCGKTTLLRLVAGFVEPDAGSIHFGARRIDAVPAHRRNTGMVFQNYALWPHLNVAKNVRYGLDLRRLSRDEKSRRVKDILALVQMTGLEERMPGELSGGQQQRVAVARALVIEPDVVLMDEPLSNLDAKLRLEMRQEIRRIHAKAPRTTVYVTHDQKEALSMADRIALMRDGRIIEVGTPEEVYAHPRSLFAAQFIGNANIVDGTVREAGGGRVSVETPLGMLTARSGEGALRAGEAAVVTVRPESLHAADADERNAFEVEVVSRMYLGELVQVQLRSGDVELAATVSGASSKSWGAGGRLRVAFDAEEAAAFAPPADGNA
jgi:iron(III) transport system ATP-binding protein